MAILLAAKAKYIPLAITFPINGRELHILSEN